MKFTKTFLHIIFLFHFCFFVMEHSIEGRYTLHQNNFFWCTKSLTFSRNKSLHIYIYIYLWCNAILPNFHTSIIFNNSGNIYLDHVITFTITLALLFRFCVSHHPEFLFSATRTLILYLHFRSWILYS